MLLPEEGGLDRRIGPFTRRSSLLVYALAAALLVVVVFFAIRQRKIYTNSVEIALLRQDVDQLRKDHDAATAAQRKEMLEILGTLYSNMNDVEETKQKVSELPARRPSTVETWMRNRDLEYQKRLKALEQWRLSLTR